MALSFAFGGNTGETPETLKRKRAIANALLASNRMPRDVGEGLSAVGDALAGRIMSSKLDKQEQAGQADANSIFGGIDFAAPAYPSSVAAGGSPTAPAATGVPSGADTAGIKAGLVERGIPEHVADGFLMNFQDESGLNPGINEQNPTVPGSRGGYGLYQLTGPRRVAYENFAKERGVDPADTNAQLDFLVSELKGPEAGAAKSIFAAPDSGSAAAAIAKNFLRPNARSLAERVAKYTSGGAPVQTASLDPAIGMGGNELPGAAQGIGGVAHEQVPPVFTPEQAKVAAALQPPQGNVGMGNVPAGVGGQPVLDVTQQPQLSSAAGLPFQGAPQPSPVASALAQPQQPQIAPQGNPGVSDALLRKNDQALGGIMAPAGTPQPVNAALSGYFPPAPSANGKPQGKGRRGEIRKGTDGQDYQFAETAGMAGDDGSGQGWIPVNSSGDFPPAPSAPNQIEQLMSVINHPYATETQKALALNQLKQLQAQNDPANQLDMDVKRAQLKALQTKDTKRNTAVINGRLVDTDTGEIVTSIPNEEKLPSGVQEYEYAKKQGFPGTFQDWEASKKGGMSLQVDPATGAVTFQQGNNIKPLTEGQSKDATFVTRAKGSLPNLDKYADSLTKFGAGIAANTPVFGNYMKSSEYQQAEQAGKEFLQAILRKDTGAAITKEETAEYGTVYLPQPGDSANTLAQKKASRDRAVQAIEAGMTPQAILASENALKQQPSATPSEEVPLDDLLKKYGG